MFLGMVGRRTSVVYDPLLREGYGRGRMGTSSNTKLESLKFSTVTMKTRSIQEYRLPLASPSLHVKSMQDKLQYSLFVLAPKWYLHSAET